MIALMLQSLAPIADRAEEAEIIITAKRLDRWRGQFWLKREKFKCKTVRSSGDRAIDPIGCAAIAECLEPLKVRIGEGDDKGLGKERQIALKKAILDELGPCVGRVRKAMVADFVAKRRAVLR